MTKVVVVKNTKNEIIKLSINDHCNYADEGEDIVCAGVSAIIIGGLNALVEEGLDDETIVIEKGNVNVDLTPNKTIQIIAQTIVTQLKTIQASYPDYIKIIYQ